MYPVELLKQFLFCIRHVFKAKLIVCQFAGHHTFLPVLFSKIFLKKSVVVAGGTDCVSFPSIGYGNFQNKLLSFTTAFCFKNCRIILPVHCTLVEYDYTYQNNDFKKQGYQFFVPDIKTPYKVIHNGYDNKKWFCNTGKEKNSFVTVGAGLGSRFSFDLKGIDLIFKIAPLFPNALFYIIGGSSIHKDVPKNVILLNTVPNDQLQPVLSKVQFYLQLSMSEGFPNALSEAMLCECVPIVSNVGGMPDIISDTGYLLKHKDLKELYELINSALSNSELNVYGKQARQRIAENYTFEKRRAELLSVTNKLE